MARLRIRCDSVGPFGEVMEAEGTSTVIGGMGRCAARTWYRELKAKTKFVWPMRRRWAIANERRVRARERRWEARVRAAEEGLGLGDDGSIVVLAPLEQTIS